MAAEIAAEFPPEAVMAGDWRTFVDFAAWSNESWTYASEVYDLRENEDPPIEYLNKLRPLTRRRVAMGGYRMV